MKRFLVAVAAAVLSTVSPVLAADTSSVPLYDVINRPFNTISPSAASTYVVAPDEILIEAGYNNLSTNGVGPTSDYPQVLAHIGTHLKNLELDVKAPSEVRGGGASASDDIAGSLKYLILKAHHYAVSAQVGASIPTGSQDGRNAGTQTNYGLNGSYKFSKMFEVRTTQSFLANNTFGLRYGSYNPSYTGIVSLPENTNLFASYAYNKNAVGPRTGSETGVLYGASHQLGERFQVDVEGTNQSIKNFTHTHGIGFGAAYKL
jgi:hypothetical protein